MIRKIIQDIKNKEINGDYDVETPIILSKELNKKFNSYIKKLLNKKYKLKDFNGGDTYFTPNCQFSINNQCFFLSLGDIRFFDYDDIMIRTIKDFNDHIGGENQYIYLKNFEKNLEDFLENYNIKVKKTKLKV